MGKSGFMHLPAFRRSNTDELLAFDAVCDALQGFDDQLNFESVDGFLTALASGPGMPPVDVWLVALCGDAFERAFADPVAHTAALRALKARLAVLRDQLDPETLLADLDELRLTPLMSEWTDETRSSAMTALETKVDAAEIAALRTGAIWANGFARAALALPDLLQPATDDPEARAEYDLLVGQVLLLFLPESDPAVRSHIAALGPAEGPPARDDLIDNAMYAVQDLRLFWLDHAPKPVTRQAGKTPGRNDPCTCGSGKKYKKCHGAAVASA